MQQPQIVTKGMSLRAIKADFERLNSSHTKLRARADLARKATNQTEALFALGNDPSGTLPAQVRNGDPLAKYRLLSPDKIRRSHREASMKLGGAATCRGPPRWRTGSCGSSACAPLCGDTSGRSPQHTNTATLLI